MSGFPEFTDNDGRLKSLLCELRPGSGPCPFIVSDQAVERVTLQHFSGGRDATYVFVSRNGDENRPLRNVTINIGYASFVEGTTIIYDLTDETLQGKARPFACNMSRSARVYALMPFQIEATAFASEGSTGARLHIAFLDARGQAIQAALPFELKLIDSLGKTLLQFFRATDRSGRFFCQLEKKTPPCQAVVRSLLTGREEFWALDAG